MSISLPNGTIISAPSSSHAAVSAAVTRILHLSNFSAELKTRDIQAIFKDWEGERGGFRIKWVDDTNALVVFSDANTAKRAYLCLLRYPPPIFLPPAVIRPYDRPDASQIIASLAARSMGHRSSMSSALTSGSYANLLSSGEGSHHRTLSTSAGSGGGGSGLSGFTMPLNSSSGGKPTHRTSLAPTAAPRTHNRAGSASSSWSRSGVGAGVLNFAMPTAPSSAPRLATHTETSAAVSRSSSASESTEPVVIMDSALPRTGQRILLPGKQERRASITADKALREVEKALASVEAQG